jgi:hypothetical protein
MAVFTPNSRYRGATVTEVEHRGELKPYTVLKKIVDVPLTTEDYYIVLDEGNMQRPDLISYQVYGTVDYGWALMEINGIRSWLDLRMGVRLRVPPVESIERAVRLSHDR